METVLIIEDSRPMQRTLQRLFEADELEVRIASDGLEGLESFRNFLIHEQNKRRGRWSTPVPFQIAYEL